MRVLASNFQNRACYEKYLKDNKHNRANVCSDICPWTLFLPQSSQFSLRYGFGKTVRLSEQIINVRGQISELHFSKWRLLYLCARGPFLKGPETFSPRKAIAKSYTL